MKEICNDQGYHVPNLRHSMLNVSTELDAVVLENSENFKRLISGEEIEARAIYGSPFVMAVTCKFLFLTNNLPRFKYGTDAELRRLLFLKFNHVPETVDTTIKQRIPAERDGVLTILVDHLRTLLRDNTIPHGGAESIQTRERFTVTNDPISSFVNTECILDPEDFTSKDSLLERFKQYLDQIGLPISFADNFLKLLYDRYPAVRPKRPRTNDGGRAHVVGGIGLKDV
jgi:phage/plasmid-associated DNA primase